MRPGTIRNKNLNLNLNNEPLHTEQEYYKRKWQKLEFHAKTYPDGKREKVCKWRKCLQDGTVKYNAVNTV